MYMRQSRCVEGLQAGQTGLGVGLFHVACSFEWRGSGIPTSIQGRIVTLGDLKGECNACLNSKRMIQSMLGNL